MKTSRNVKYLVASVLSCAGALCGAETVPMDNPAWGYKITGLGDNGDEVALVFTNAVDKTMTWAPGLDLQGVRYLLVGGGGAGGSGYASSSRSTTYPDMGGGGGGAGAGFEGTIDVSASDEISVVVGAGGVGAVSSPGGDGGASSLTVGEQTISAAGGGGGGRAINSSSLDVSLANGRAGGCGGGGAARCKVTSNNSDKSAQAGGASTDAAHGSAGGKGYVYTTNHQLCYGGGGGGITGAGTAGGGLVSGNNRVGGAGLLSSITGADVTYGGGGGGGGATATNGGAGGAGGGGKGGDNNTVTATLGCGYPGVDGLGGGGGGGTGYSAAKDKKVSFAGGNGGSGVVIIRYAQPAGRVAVPVVRAQTYTGETLVAEVPASDGYVVTRNDGGVNVGTYVVAVALNSGYTWNDGSTEPVNVDFVITPAQNEWTVEPAISKGAWLTTDAPGVLTAGATTFGTPAATIAKDGGAAEPFGGKLPTAAGAYVISYAVEASDNWHDPEVTVKTVSFTVVSDDVMPQFTVTKEDVAASVGESSVGLSVGYAVHCEVESDKRVDIYASVAEDGAAVTNEVKIAEGVALDAVGTGVVPNLKPDVTYWVALNGRGGDQVAPLTAFSSVTLPGPATGLAAAATFTNDPKEFVIAGSVTPGLGTTTVYVRWSLNSSDLDNLATHTFVYGEAGAFTNTVAYVDPTDTLTWDVAVSNVFATAALGEQTWDGALPVSTKTRSDTVATTYHWIGGKSGDWADSGNWRANRTECFGYPNNVTYATARITTTTTINLGGASFSVVKGSGLLLDANSGDVVTLTNGTLRAEFNADSDFGAAGATVIFRDATLQRTRLNPVTGGMTTIFEGQSRLTGMVRPWEATDAKIIFRNGDISIGGNFGNGSGKSGTEIVVSNATVTVEGAANSSWKPGMFPVTLQNGPDRQARIVHKNSAGFDFVQSPYTLAIPAEPYKMPYLQAVKSGQFITSSPTFNIDVTNWKRGRRVPILTFTQSATGAASQYGSATLRAYDKGVNVTEKRNARLEWDAEKRTLYYKQNSLHGFLFLID